MVTQQQLNKELIQELTELREEIANKEAQFRTEKNTKNFLYYFILTNNLLTLFAEFKYRHENEDEDYYLKSLEFLVNNSAE